MKTCLYAGQVSHSRFRPRWHSFRYRLSLLWLNLDELDASGGGERGASILGRRWQWLLPVKARDHLRNLPGAGCEKSLKARLSALVADRLGLQLNGSVFLLTGFGFLWHRFNPVSFYYCFDEDNSLQCLVAEVTNTPWKEQYYYVLDARRQRGRECLSFQCAKGFHVSPFMPMDTFYRWRLNIPGEHLHLIIDIDKDGEKVFNASLSLERRALSSRGLWSSLWSQPFTSIKVVAAIHWQAFRLWLKSTPLFPHPKHTVGEKS